MFATVLKEVGGFFDRRAIATVFFPSLVFWTGSALTVGLVEQRTGQAVGLWSHQPSVVQAGIVVGWIAFVVFWSLLWQAAGTAQDRLFQGHWPQEGPLSLLTRGGSGRHARIRRKMIKRDLELEQAEIATADERATFPDPASIGTAPTTWPSERIDQEIDALESCLSRRTSPDPLPGWSQRCRVLAEQLAPHSGSTQDPAWRLRLSRFAIATTEMSQALDEAELSVREQRSALQQQLFLRYPQPPVKPLPTRLGNAIRAAEQYPRVRYGLDPVVIWSRLQPVLPADYADAVRSAKAALDLLCTLAAYLGMFGLPLAIWTAARVPDPSRPVLLWAALTTAGLCTVGISIAARRSRLGILALVLIVVSAVPLVLTLTHRSAALPGQGTLVLRLGLAGLLCTEILALSLIAYRGAVQSGIRFAEKLRSAFDLHRSRVLDGMGLRVPDNLAEERQIWATLCAFLYRGAEPEAGALPYAEPVPPLTACCTGARIQPAGQP